MTRLYRVMSVSVARNVRGEEMRRLQLAAIGGEVFGDASAPSDGAISELVTVEEAERFPAGATFSVSFRPHEDA